MSFITSKKNSGSRNTTRGLYLGTTEAEGEINPGQGLKEYYEDYLEIDEEFSAGKFIITGRKGVGKSAYVKHLCDNSSLDNGLLCSLVKYNTKTLEKIIQGIPDEISDKYCVLHEWIILSEMVKLLLKNTNASSSKGYDAIRKFSEKNSGILDITKWMTVSREYSTSFEVSFYDLFKWMPGKFGKSLKTSQMRAPFYCLIPSLRNVVSEMLSYEVCKDIKFVVIFDDLDIGFNLNNDQHKTELMDLIRLARDYNTRYFPNLNSRVLLMLRDDIAMYLDGIASDKNKIFSSYEYNLNWYDSDKDLSEEQSHLRAFINRRISIGFEKLGLEYNHSDAWSSLVDEGYSGVYSSKSAFKYVIDCTFYRPRDLVALFKDIGKCNYTIPIDPDNMKTLISKYAHWNAMEIKDELSNLFSRNDIESIFGLLRRISDSREGFSYDEIIAEIGRLHLREDAFAILLDYCLIVPMDKQEYFYYSYREKIRLEHEQDYRYKLSKALYIHFKPQTL